MPLYSIGLCDADITAPMSALYCLVRYAIAGVGRTPASITSAPMLMIPALSASDSISFDKRVSLPITTFTLSDPCSLCFLST